MKKMEQYKNFNGNSNIKAFSFGTDYIDIQFNKGAIYRYSYNSAGSMKVEQMKELAIKGCGLNSYIMRNAKKEYERRLNY